MMAGGATAAFIVVAYCVHDGISIDKLERYLYYWRRRREWSEKHEKACPIRKSTPRLYTERLRNMWDKVSAITAVISVIISIAALIAAVLGTRASSKLAVEALETARHANNIALRREREPPSVEFSSVTINELDFAEPFKLGQELKTIITIKNIGKISVDGLSLEIIGIEPFTYPLNDPNHEVRPLPSVMVNVPLKTLLQPNALAHVDMRVPVLMYLKKIKNQTHPSTQYQSMINIVLQPKAVGDSLPSGVLSDVTKSDRKLIKIIFNPSIVDTEPAQGLLKNNQIAHRVYSP